MIIAGLAFTEQGYQLGQSLQQQLGPELILTRCPPGGLGEWTATNFSQAEALLFIGAAAIAVRAIGPLLQDKCHDPAVLALDERGSYVIPLLSGHLGGGNELARRLAKLLDALAIITTATDINGVWAVDDWARRQGLIIANPARIKWISARLLAGESLGLKSLFPIKGILPTGLRLEDNEYEILITWRKRGRDTALRLVPPLVTLGVGCKKGISKAALTQALEQTLAKSGCHAAALGRVCSIELKAGEEGLRDFCEELQLPLKFFSAQQLAAVPGHFNGSEFVQKITGVDNVCERAAIAGSGPGSRLLSAKNAGNGVTMALAIPPYSISFEEVAE